MYVIDSNDVERLPEAQEELEKLLNEPQLNGLPLLLFCNKEDLPNSMSVNEIVKKLDFTRHKRPWKAQALCALTGDGLFEGFDWMASALTKSHKV